ncbi:MAG: transporter substrate-binding domain-containing protein, partial [Desulfobulbaceae bacterium]|nr:transporter substrate-binding domain-containing protein [Desulfobulbaceae bacterium]
MLPKSKIIPCQLIAIIITLLLVPTGQASTSRILQSASELDYPPFAIVLPDGTADGFSVELLKAVTRAAGLQVEITVGPWNDIRQKLADKQLDVLPLVSYSPERDRIFDFTAPYLQMHGTIFVRKGEKTIHNKSDLPGKEVLVMRGDTAHEYAIREKLTDSLILTESFEEAMKMLSAGRHDAVIVQHLMGLQLIEKLDIDNIISVNSFQETSLKPTAGTLSGFEQKFCFAVQEGDAKLLSQLNEGLTIVFANGTYEQLYNKWFSPILPRPPVPITLLLKYLLFALIPILFLLAMVGYLYSKKEVTRKTGQLREEILQRKKNEKKLYATAYSLGERVKELHCLYSLYQLIEKDLATEELFQGAAELLPPAWQYPESTCARINLLDQSYRTDNFAETQWLQSRQIRIAGQNAGVVEVYYLEEKPAMDEGPFLREERDLINAIAARLGRIVEQKRAEKEQVKLEIQLRQAIKMQAVGTLAGGIAHEFNNLLGVIIGCTDMARDEVPKGSFAETQLDKVLKACDRVQILVRKILSFSRQGQQKIIVAQLYPQIKESLKLIRSSIPSSVEIHTDIDTFEGATLVDPTEIQQIIMNLCSNAVWAMEEKGTIELTMRQVQLNSRQATLLGITKDSYIQFSFADSGQGMDIETQSRIFEPFYTRKEVGHGTGMGLAIVYAIMESYQGAITVESEVGKGTTFHLYFPVSDEPVVEEQEQAGKIPTGNERILLVDDEENYARMLAMMIGRLGYDVDLKTHSPEALESFQAAPDSYDLLITDQIMPQLSGA